MKKVRTKSGTLPLDDGKTKYVVTEQGVDLPDDLAESIRGHANIEIDGPPPGEQPKADDLDPRTGTPKAPAVDAPAMERAPNPKIESGRVDPNTGKAVEPVKATRREQPVSQRPLK